MQFGPLDIPDEVIAAQEAGELVIFTGAGVSYGGTSKLPLFEGLTDQIGTEIQKTRDPPNRKDFDVVLGEWHEGHGSLVHKAAHRIVGRTTSQPNDAHQLLLQLFKKPEHVRVVTTNYDRHFSTVAGKLSLTLPHYRAPALPLGDDFHGIVYLHGSVDDKPERLVLTDADFGRAYLSQGWARTFLQSLYARFHVLFVGFSHEDVLLTYLARGLPTYNRRQRHALQIEGGYARWKQLGIEVIPYARSESPDPHENLTHGLRCWVETSSLRPQDARARVRDIVDAVEAPTVVVGSEAGPSAIQLGRDREDFLRRSLREQSSAVWFLERAQSLRWIGWLNHTGVLPSIAEDDSAVNLPQSLEAKTMLIHWATSLLVRSHQPEALELFVKLGGRLGNVAWRAAASTLVSKETAEAWGSPHIDNWLTAIRLGYGERPHFHFLSPLIAKLVEHAKTDHAVAFFWLLLTVRVEWEHPWTQGLDESFAAKPKVAGDLHDLKEAWKALKPLRTPAVDEQLLRVLVTTVENVYSVYGSNVGELDPITSLRINVDKPRSPYDPHDAEESIVDMLLDVIRTRAASGDGVSEAQIIRWLNAPQLGWRRLAYFALRVDRRVSTERKVEIITEQKLICPTSWQLQHDPSSLVAFVFGQADAVAKNRLLEVVIAGPHIHEPPAGMPAEVVDKEEIRLRDQFLYRVALANKTEPILIALFSRLGLAMPGTEAIDKRLIYDGKFGFIRDSARSPKKAEELLQQTPESQIDYILSYKGEGDQYSGFNRGGLLSAVVEAANTSVSWARALIEILLSRNVTTGDLWDQLVWGLSWQTKDADFRRWLLIEVMPKIEPADWELPVWNGWTFHLFRLGDGKILESLTQEEWDALFTWSLRAWAAAKTFDEPVSKVSDNSDTLTRAINHPVGRVVEFWIKYLDHFRRTEPTASYEWPAKLGIAVKELMLAEGMNRLMGAALFGQYLSFIRYAVPSWTNQEIYPHMGGARSSDVSFTLWSAWLCYGRLSVDLAKDMPPFLEANAPVLLAGEKEEPNRLLSYAAAIAAGPFPPTDSLRWIKAILKSATVQQRGWWNQEVARCLGGHTSEHRQAIWKLWGEDPLTTVIAGC